MQVELTHPRLIEPTGLPRSEGIHISNIIRVIAVQNGALKPEYVESLDLVERSNPDWWSSLDSVNQLRMSIGQAWEQWYVQTQLPHVLHQPGEMQVEGIYMTHDGESLETIVSERREQLVMALHEVKTTSKSTKTVGEDLRSQWMWLAQMKAYCKGLNTMLAFLHVLFLNGDYSYPMRPLLRVYVVQFTQAEIDDNWELLTGYVRHQQLQLAENSMRDTE